MFNLLGEGTNVASIVGLVILFGLLILYFVFGMRTRKKQQEEAMKMMEALKEGDKIVTNAGIYGEIVGMKETDMGRVITIKTGEEKQPCYLTINASVIVGIDKKKDLILDKDGNPIDENDEKLKEEILEEKAKDVDNTTKKETKKETKKTTRKTLKKND